MKRFTALAAAGVLSVAALAACSSDADVVNENLTKEADNFKIVRRVVFYNGITGQSFLSVEGRCSVDPGDANRMTVTCKTGDDEYKRHFLGKADNVTWFAEQLDPASVSADHYKIVFNPSLIVPNVEAR